MLNPDATTDIAACLARLGVLEQQRRDALLQKSTEAERAAIAPIADRQQADALAFARRCPP